MEITSREIATIIPALECWKEELFEGADWIPEMKCFQRERPLSQEDVDELLARLRCANGISRTNRTASYMRGKLELSVPTFVGHRKQSPEGDDFTSPHVPVLISKADGVRIMLGEHDFEDTSKPDIQVERRPHGWALFVHPNADERVACLYILDDGRTLLLPEGFVSEPLKIVDDIPPDLDGP